VDPTECCVASWHGSTAYRLKPGQSGFVNLYLAGTWTHTGMNATCVEGAVMSGMAASRAICGEPRNIVGNDFLQSSSEQQ
jgi:phytoene dehydrogenase-like protein